MIDGIKLQFTTEELRRHFLDLADWWESQGHRAADIVLFNRGKHTEAELAAATKQAKNIAARGQLWRMYAKQLPGNEVFFFTLKQLEEIQWPTLPVSEVPEAEFEAALFYSLDEEVKKQADRILTALGVPSMQPSKAGGKGFLS